MLDFLPDPECRVCGCTAEWGCDEGCGWATVAHDLCTACVDHADLAAEARERQMDALPGYEQRPSGLLMPRGH